MAGEDVNVELALHHLHELLDKREFPKTICPSEAARALSKEELKQSGASEWRDMMPGLRQQAFQLRDSGVVEVLQKGQVLPQEQGLDETTGPIRLRKQQV